MVTIEEFITAVFCCVDDLLKEITQGQSIREKGFAPALADSEVMTMEIVAEYQGIDADQAIWKYFRRHWLSLFPKLSSRSAFVRQAANLWQYKELLQQRLAAHLGTFTDTVHLVDGIPSFCADSAVRRDVVASKENPIMATVRQRSRPTMGFMVICSSVPLG